MTKWIDDLARDIRPVESDRDGTTVQSRRGILARLLGFSIGISSLALANVSPVVAAKCKKNKDCSKNKRCRKGKCERISDNDGNDNGNDKWAKAGKYARDEGVDEVKVDRQGNDYWIDFRSNNSNLSGSLDLALANDRATFSFDLEFNDERLTAALNNRSFSVTDDRGQAAAATWDLGRNRWTYSDRSEQVFKDSKRQMRVGLALIADLGLKPRELEIEGITIAGEATAAAETCSEHFVSGSSLSIDPYIPIVSRSVACELATKALKGECRRESGCNGCCQVLDECDCICFGPFGSDFLCGCDRTGYPFDKTCA